MAETAANEAMAEETPTDGEELAQLRDELDAARAEIDRLERDTANASSAAESLRGQLAEADERADSASRVAAARYRELMLRAEPALPAEMIAGETLDAIDASVVAARDVVGRVRSHIESQASSARVPAGAPQRAAPDLSDMSPQQKIRYGLEQRSQS